MAKKQNLFETWHLLTQSGNTYAEISEQYGIEPTLIHTALKNQYPKAGYSKKPTKTPYQKLFDQGIDLNVLKTLKNAGFDYKTIQEELFLPFTPERLRQIMVAQFGDNLPKSHVANLPEPPNLG